MRVDLLVWTRRLMALVFLAGLAAIIAAVFILVRQSEGVPPMPIFTGLVAAVALVLLAGASLALVSIAGAARRGANALERLAQQGVKPAPSHPFSASPLREAEEAGQAEATVKPPRPAGKKLVAER